MIESRSGVAKGLGSGEQQKGGFTESHKELLRGDGYVHYLVVVVYWCMSHVSKCHKQDILNNTLHYM